MTVFQFNLFNHTPIGRESLEDVLDPMAAQLLDLGHRAHRCDDFFAGPPHWNVVNEGFNESIIDMLRRAREQIAGFKLIILCTERPSDSGGFNNQTRGEMVMRQQHFPAVAKMADGIWCLVPEAVEWYRRHHPKTAHVELGYSPRRVIPHVQPAEFDFGFFGSLTPRREAILHHLRKRGHKVHILKPIEVNDSKGGKTWRLPDKAERNAEMQRCKIILQLKPADNWQIISSSRCNTAINLGRAIVAEPHNSNSLWKRVVRFSSTPFNLIPTAEKALEDFEGEWVRQFCRFREILPAQVCLGKALEKVACC